MTTTDSLAPRMTMPARPSTTTIYRDSPLPASTQQAFREQRSSVRLLTAPNGGWSDALLLALQALMVPAVLYSLWQTLILISGGSLEQAIRAYVP